MHDINFFDTSDIKHNPREFSNEVLVDVFIPVRNGAEYLSEAINSVLNQTFSNFRLIVVDNNSTDGTSEIIRSFSDSRLEVITHDTTLPLFENLNFCLSLVRAPFFCILHADDRLLPDYLGHLSAALRAEPDADIAFCKVNTIDESGNNISNIKYKLKNRLFLSHQGLVRRGTIYGGALNFVNFVVAPSIMYRREILDKVGVFRTDLSFYGDIEYLQRGLNRGVAYLSVSRTLFEYRLHGKQETANVTKNLYKYRETLRYFSGDFDSNAIEKYSRKHFSPVAAQARVAFVAVWDYMFSSGYETAPFRAGLIDYLLEIPILPKCAFLWRLLGRGVGWSRAPRQIMGGFIILCVVLPILLLHAVKV